MYASVAGQESTMLLQALPEVMALSMVLLSKSCQRDAADGSDAQLSAAKRPRISDLAFKLAHGLQAWSWRAVVSQPA